MGLRPDQLRVLIASLAGGAESLGTSLGRKGAEQRALERLKAGQPPRRQLVRGESGDYESVDVETGLNPAGKSVRGYTPPERKDDMLVQVQKPDGSVVYMLRSDAVNQPAPSRATIGSAALKKAVTSNQTQVRVIDDALKELERYPQAVGGARALGDVVPFLGGVSDYVNQRADPRGVAARAQIANIGSLVIHDRSGAAVTISEFPRLAPFVPRVGDTPQVIRTKLAKLRQNLEAETGFLQEQLGAGGEIQPTPASTGSPPPSAPPVAPATTPPPSAPSVTAQGAEIGDDEFARAWKALTRAGRKAEEITDDLIADWLAKNPRPKLGGKKP